jgi:hypothetical protein
MDKHQNLFYSYSTHHLEDNVTRALAITLKHLSPAHLRLFLRDVIARKSGLPLKDRIRLLARPNFEFELQVGSNELDKLSEDDGLIVGINYGAQQRLVFDENFITAGGARPDMLVSDKENGVTVIFEVKLGDLLYRDQIQRHFNMFFDPIRARLDRVFVEISWTDIAEFINAVRQQSRDPVEDFLIRDLIDYLDFLNLTDFMPFRASDFNERNYAKLHKIIAVVEPDLRTNLGTKEYEFNKRVYFEATPDNLWIDYAKHNLLVAVIVGDGNQQRARALQTRVNNDPAQFRLLLEHLYETLKTFGTLTVNTHARFRLNRFRTAKLDIDENRFPDDYDRFVATFSNARLNSHRHLTKGEIMETFGEHIADQATADMVDPNGQFPRWEGGSFLQYCWVSFDLLITEERLIGRSRTELGQLLETIFGAMKQFMRAV